METGERPQARGAVIEAAKRARLAGDGGLGMGPTPTPPQHGLVTPGTRVGSMFVVASTGRCGSQAICNAFDDYSDHRVRHEPEPLLLEDAWRAHQGRRRRSLTYYRRMREFRRTDGTPYGESVRCPTLLGDIADAAPSSRVVVLFRRPEGYLRSAWQRGVMRKGDQWDRWRLLPPDAARRDPVDQIALHYAEVNRVLAETAGQLGERALVVELVELDDAVDAIAGFVGAEIVDREGMAAFLRSKPNAGPSGPWGADPQPEVSPDALEAAEVAYERLVSLLG